MIDPLRHCARVIACGLIAGVVILAVACGGSDHTAEVTHATRASSGVVATASGSVTAILTPATVAETATATVAPTPTSTPVGPLVEVAPEAAALDGLYQELLGLIPDTDDTREYVGITNVALIHALYDIEPPVEPADKGAWNNYIGQAAWRDVGSNAPVAWTLAGPTYLSRANPGNAPAEVESAGDPMYYVSGLC